MKTYLDSKAPVSERVEDLLIRMSIEEKTAQMSAQWLILDPDGNHLERDFEMSSDCKPRTSVKEHLQYGIGQITRPLGTRPVSPEEGVAALNRLQKMLVEETRLGIPAMSHEECLVGLMVKHATLFPSSLNFGHTWNPELIRSMATEIGEQARQVGAHQGLAPVLDVSRDVRWGRTEETLGEDPYLTGVLATEYVQGLQGAERDILATLKHFVGHSYSEGARNHAPVHVGFRELNDTFLLPFEMAVKLGNAGSVMPAYHDIDGEPCHASRHLLTKVLREEWGFDGLIVADYGGVELLATHHAVANNRAEAAALAFNAGLDIELPDDACARSLREAVSKGLISESKIDEVVRRILKIKFELGLFERPYISTDNLSLNSEKAKSLAYQVAAESVVLTENNGELPLDRDAKIAVIGATADDPLALLGGYSFPVHLILGGDPEEHRACKSILEALRERFEEVTYHKGCEILAQRHSNAPVFPGDTELATDNLLTSPVSSDTSQIAGAVRAAEGADTAIVCVGDLAGLFQTGTVGEGSDTDSLNLPGVQQNLLEKVIETGTPVVVVVTGGRPYNLRGAEEKAAAVIYAWAPGQEGADALGDILTGITDPSGRLTLSIPKSAGAVPYYYNHKLKSGGTPIAYHFGSKYNFGYGLTYTEFHYENFEVSDHTSETGGWFVVSADILNTGERAGTEVVQLYIRDCVSSIVRPVKELKGFRRVRIQVGEKRRVSFKLPVDMLNFTDLSGRRVVEPGEFSLMLGKSSSEILFNANVCVKGGKRYLEKDWEMVSKSEIK